MTIYLHGLSIMITFCFFFHLVTSVVAGSSPALHYPAEVDNFAVNCGYTGNSTALDGRRWTGDSNSNYYYIISHESTGKLISSRAVDQQLLSIDPIPYATARISRYQFSYTFKVTPGKKIIRLHFYPASSYSGGGGFKRSEAFFTVKSGPYTLLSNFSPSPAADALGLNFFTKEFLVNVEEEDQLLSIAFIPSPASSSSSSSSSLDNQVYAFVNGIEIVSVPTELYYTREGDLGARVVGEKYRFSIDNSIALEKVHRLNVGGGSISSVEDTTGMFREWSDDSNYLLESLTVLPVITTIRIKYAKIPTYIAPQRVYQTSWSGVPNKKADVTTTFNGFTWKLPVDLGFRYLVRFHFCELEYEIQGDSHKQFSIFFNKQMAEPNASIIKWSGASGVAVYRDYVVMMEGDRMEGKRDLLLTLCPHEIGNNEGRAEGTDAILKGLEVFKLSNPDNNLAGMNPVPITAATPSNPNRRKLVFSSGRNAIATAVVIIISILNIIVYKLRVSGENLGERNISATVVVIISSILNIIVHKLGFRGENLGERNISTTFVLIIFVYILLVWVNIWLVWAENLRERSISSSSSSSAEGLCRRFTLAEVQLATNNFHEDFKIGKGGFGKVYKGVIDGGATTVAIKRLDSESKQGADEFWAEIETLSKLRHSHLVSLIGYCDEFQEKIIVYEYMKHGTLAEHLYKINSNGNGNINHLSWAQRINICIGAARGLDYLHTCTQHDIIHRYVKTTNILLDEDWVAKVSDFGLCKIGTKSHSRNRVTHITASLKGTFGFWDPDYFLTGRLTKKSDVFAFGVVLLEVLCGRPVVDTRVEEDQRSLVLWAQRCIKEKKLDEIIDPSLRGKISPHCLKAFVEIANECLHSRPNGRPKMADVVARLERTLTSLDYSSRDSSPPEEDIENVDDVLQGYDSISGELLQESDAEHIREFSIEEIRAATKKFRDMIGRGSFGEVYKGWINGGTLEVAIRRMSTSGASDMFRAQIKVHSQLRHLHILSLIGYCCDEGESILVHKHMANRSLCDHLYGLKSGYHHPLPWKKRLEICIGAARGLQYLHSGTSHTVVHRNIKPSQILLDENWVAKVQDFGLSKVLPEGSMGVTTDVRGTFGYLDPEYFITGLLTEKSDVYSFGVVLLEVLCAKKPVDCTLDEDRTSLVQRFETSIRRKTIKEIIDPYLVGRIAPKCLGEFVKVISNCLLDRGRERPSMNDVAGKLQLALQLQQDWATGLAK